MRGVGIALNCPEGLNSFLGGGRGIQSQDTQGAGRRIPGVLLIHRIAGPGLKFYQKWNGTVIRK